MKRLLHAITQKPYHHVWFFLFLFFMATLSYLPIFSLSFTADDFVWLAHAKQANFPFINDIFTLKISNFLMSTIYAYFIAAYHVFDLQPYYYYLINIFLHAANAFTLFLITKHITSHKHIAYITSISFLLFRYPMEAIAWISAVTVLFSTLFLLLSGYSWVRYLKSRKMIHFFLTLLWGILLMLTKEWSVLLPPFLLMLTYLFVRERKQSFLKVLRKTYKQILLFVPMFLIYLFFQYSIQHTTSPLIEKNIYVFGLHSIPNIIHNIFLSFIPIHSPVHTGPSLLFWLTTLGLFFLTVITVYYEKKKARVLPFYVFLSWMIIAYIPTSFFTWNPYVSRYAYLPAIGAALFVGYLVKITSTRAQKGVFYVLLIVYISINLIFTQKVIKETYIPQHRQVQVFLTQVSQLPKPTETNFISFTNPLPIQDFIIPEALFLYFDIPTSFIHISREKETCTESCYSWNIDTQQLINIK